MVIPNFGYLDGLVAKLEEMYVCWILRPLDPIPFSLALLAPSSYPRENEG